MKSIIYVRNYRNLVQSDRNDTELHWIKFYPDRLLGSMNFRRCDIREQSLYLSIFIRVRRDGDFCGKLCYPSGEPITFEELLDDMNPRERDRTDLWKQALQGLIEKTLIHLEDSKSSAPQLPEDCSATGKRSDCPLPGDCKSEVPETKGVMKSSPTDKNKSNNKDKEKDMLLSLFTHWNGLPNVLHHKVLTDKMKRAINGRLAEGYTTDDIRQMMSNYAEILAGGLEVPPRYRWTFRWGLIDFLARHKDRFNDIGIARQNFQERKDNNVQCSECNGEGVYKIQGTEQRCHKCGGKGFHPDPKLMRKE